MIRKSAPAALVLAASFPHSRMRFGQSVLYENICETGAVARFTKSGRTAHLTPLNASENVLSDGGAAPL